MRGRAEWSVALLQGFRVHYNKLVLLVIVGSKIYIILLFQDEISCKREREREKHVFKWPSSFGLFGCECVGVCMCCLKHKIGKERDRLKRRGKRDEKVKVKEKQSLPTVVCGVGVWVCVCEKYSRENSKLKVVIKEEKEEVVRYLIALGSW